MFRDDSARLFFISQWIKVKMILEYNFCATSFSIFNFLGTDGKIEMSLHSLFCSEPLPFDFIVK
jgi:hypothetical protein